jgi:hypothetical protein
MEVCAQQQQMQTMQGMLVEMQALVRTALARGDSHEPRFKERREMAPLYESYSPRLRAKTVGTSTSNLPVPPIELKGVSAAVGTSTTSLANETSQEVATLERSGETVDPRTSWSGTVQLGSSVSSLRSCEARVQRPQSSPERTPSASVDLPNHSDHGSQHRSEQGSQVGSLVGSQIGSRAASQLRSQPEDAAPTHRPVPATEGRGDSDAETVRATPSRVPRSESSVSSAETERLRLSPDARAAHRPDVPRIDATILSYPSLTDRSDWGGTAAATPRLRKPGEPTPRSTRWSADDNYEEDDETLRILRKYVSSGRRDAAESPQVR